MSTQRQKNQLELAFDAQRPGESVDRANEGSEVLVAERKSESPAMSGQLMAEVLERENLKKALKRVQKKKGIASLCIGGGEAVSVLVEML